jgi:hypothetical protein
MLLLRGTPFQRFNYRSVKNVEQAREADKFKTGQAFFEKVRISLFIGFSTIILSILTIWCLNSITSS